MGTFKAGDKVEISMNEEGLTGSYYTATILYSIVNDSYIVQYKTLLRANESGPLREIVTGDAVRPVPPPPLVNANVVGYSKNDKVDVFYNDGWWVGVISGKAVSDDDDKYWVWFDSTKEEIECDVSDLRVHQDWVNGNWV